MYSVVAIEMLAPPRVVVVDCLKQVSQHLWMQCAYAICRIISFFTSPFARRVRQRLSFCAPSCSSGRPFCHRIVFMSNCVVRVVVCLPCRCLCPLSLSPQADAPVARNSLQAISVMATQHVSDKIKGDDGLSAHLAAKPNLFVGVLRTLLQVSPEWAPHNKKCGASNEILLSYSMRPGVCLI